MNLASIARRITLTLFVTQGLVGAAFIAGGTVSAIVAAQLSGNPAWAGLPTAISQLASAFAAVAVSAASDRIGRRHGLALGLAVGMLGFGLAIIAILLGLFPLFLAGAVMVGVASAAIRLARFAAAEVHPSETRGRAISSVVIGGALGAVMGPLLLGPSARWAGLTGIAEMAGPYTAAVGMMALATLVVYLLLRPDPREVGQQVAQAHPEDTYRRGPARRVSRILRTPAALVALMAMMFGQVAMAMMTGIVSLYMSANQDALVGISLVISAHNLGMYVFSLLVGRLTDRWGRGRVILTGAMMLLISCALAPLSSDTLPLALALFLLGVGWNFSYVGGSALLADQLSPEERARAQGTNDLLVALATAAASFGTGLLFAGPGYPAVGLVAAALSLGLVGVTGWWLLRIRRLERRARDEERCPAEESFAGFAPPVSCQL